METEKKPVILLVDDEPDIVDLLQMRLVAAGFEVVTAADGKEALNSARTLNPDLIILDLMLPTMDGFVVSRLLKFDARHKHIPIIMLTAKAGEAMRMTGEQVGVDAYFNKPFDTVQLIAKVRELLSRKEE